MAKPNNTVTIKIDMDKIGKIEAGNFVIDPKVGLAIVSLLDAENQIKGIKAALSAEFKRLYDAEGITAILSDDVRVSVSKPAESLFLTDKQAAADAGLLKVVPDMDKVKVYQKNFKAELKSNKEVIPAQIVPPGFEVRFGDRRVTYTKQV